MNEQVAELVIDILGQRVIETRRENERLRKSNGELRAFRYKVRKSAEDWAVKEANGSKDSADAIRFPISFLTT